MFGHGGFRPLQDRIIQHVTAGGDALALLPTGGGKSLCYQIPALCRPGTGLVISPLVALMRAQCDSLVGKGVRAASLHAGQEPGEAAAILDRVGRGEFDLLYVSPERATTPSFLSRLARCRLSLIAIDEAHCVSQWGHAFRPAYRDLTRLLAAHPDVPRLALTATGDHRTLEDLRRQLWLERAPLFRSSLARPNLALSVSLDPGPGADLALRLTARARGASLIYVRSRRRADQTAAALTRKGRPAMAYHAGLEPEERARVEKAFLEDPAPVVVATVAFGMGLDRPDCGLVLHLDLPESVEAYWQEVGRAGRDGKPAQAVLAYGFAQALAARRRLAGLGQGDPHQDHLPQDYPAKIETGSRSRTGTDAPWARAQAGRLGAMLDLAETTECRSLAALRHFHETDAEPCGVCDVCRDPVNHWDVTAQARRVLDCLSHMGPAGARRLVATLEARAPSTSSGFWMSLLRQMVARGLLGPGDTTTQTVAPTPAGQVWLAQDLARPGAAPFLARADWSDGPSMESKAGPGEPPACAETDSDDPLSRLTAARARLAQEAGLPPVLICHDRTLKEIASLAGSQTPPATPEDLAEAAGLTGTASSRYASALLAALQK